MKGKLVKVEDGRFHLWLNVGTKDADHIASNEPLIGEWGRNLLKYKLSLKNCQAIENDYDLDELARNCETNPTYAHEQGFIKGFQKAIEILGNKKFNERDMLMLAIECWNTASRPEYGATYNINEIVDTYIQSLQQTEWDVEIEMICPHPQDTYRCGIEYGCDTDGCNHPNKVPYIDKDGCLILKKK